MNPPSQIFDRIRRQKARPMKLAPSIRPAPAPAPTAVQPAPQPAPAPAGMTAPPPSPAPAAPPAGMTTARPAGSHALYSQVMRRHDLAGKKVSKF